jgi:hypothetical protein
MYMLDLGLARAPSAVTALGRLGGLPRLAVRAAAELLARVPLGDLGVSASREVQWESRE